MPVGPIVGDFRRAGGREPPEKRCNGWLFPPGVDAPRLAKKRNFSIGRFDSGQTLVGGLVKSSRRGNEVEIRAVAWRPSSREHPKCRSYEKWSNRSVK